MPISTEHQRADRHYVTAIPEPELVEPDRRGGRAWLVLAVFVVGAEVAGLIGLPFTDRVQGGWYDTLTKPWFNPPSWVFGPVWTTLYALIGLAAWLVWRHVDSPQRTRALALWVVQLCLNAAWTPMFFGAQWVEAALVEIVVLWFAAAATLLALARVDRWAALAFTPYLLWITYATALNAGIAVLN